MKIHPDCYPCLLRQMERTAKAAGAASEGVRTVRSSAVQALESLWDDGASPPAVSAPLYEMAGQICGSDDPFLPQKVRYTRESLKLLPLLDRLVQEAADPFETAVRISIAGNVIDFGTGSGDEVGDLEATLMDFLYKPFFRNDVNELGTRAREAEKILYLGDNAGETVFDRPLLSLLPPGKVTYAAKSGPIINDATVEDARLAGVHLHAELIGTGARTPGTILDTCSKEFLGHYKQADLVISKGQGNFETLTEERAEGKIFMLFTVKCTVAADFLGAEMGDMVVMKH